MCVCIFIYLYLHSFWDKKKVHLSIKATRYGGAAGIWISICRDGFDPPWMWRETSATGRLHVCLTLDYSYTVVNVHIVTMAMFFPGEIHYK